MIDSDSVSLALSGRVAVYRMLHAVLATEPTKNMLEMLHGAESKEVLSMFSSLSSAFQDALGELMLLLDNAGEPDDLLNKLSVCYTRLFIGPGNPEVCAWESVYLNKDRALFQPSTLEVRKAYVAQDLIPTAYPNVADDHIAIELDFMAKLGQRMVAAYGEGSNIELDTALKASGSFLDKHMMSWMPKFVSAFETAPHKYFYQEVSRLLLCFLEVDRMLLAEIAESSC